MRKKNAIAKCEDLFYDRTYISVIENIQSIQIIVVNKRTSSIKMDKTLRILIMIAIIIVGLVIGGVLGFFGLFWICEYLDAQDAARASQGGGYVAVGWIFLFITIPLGALLGGLSAFFGCKSILLKKKCDSTE